MPETDLMILKQITSDLAKVPNAHHELFQHLTDFFLPQYEYLSSMAPGNPAGKMMFFILTGMNIGMEFMKRKTEVEQAMLVGQRGERVN